MKINEQLFHFICFKWEVLVSIRIQDEKYLLFATKKEHLIADCLVNLDFFQETKNLI